MNEQRWLEAIGSLPDEVVRALREAPGDPGDAAVDGLASQLGRTLGVTLPVAKAAAVSAAQSAAAGVLGGPAAAAVTAPSGLGFVTGLLGGVVLGVGLSGAVSFGLSSFDGPSPQIAARPAVTAALPPPRAVPPPSGASSSNPVASSATAAPLSAAGQAKPTTAVAPLAEQRLATDSELTLLKRAQSELGITPARALLLADEHAARFAGGALDQEREVIAIDALLRLGRHDEALARAEHFRRTFPSSAHERRIDVLLAAAKVSH